MGLSPIQHPSDWPIGLLSDSLGYQLQYISLGSLAVLLTPILLPLVSPLSHPVSHCITSKHKCIQFSGEMERGPVTRLLLLDVKKATLHLNSSSTFTRLVQQCRKGPDRKKHGSGIFFTSATLGYLTPYLLAPSIFFKHGVHLVKSNAGPVIWTNNYQTSVQ